MLKMNVERNDYANLIALNIGVAEEPGQEVISFWDRRYGSRTDTLEKYWRARK